MAGNLGKNDLASELLIAANAKEVIPIKVKASFAFANIALFQKKLAKDILFDTLCDAVIGYGSDDVRSDRLYFFGGVAHSETVTDCIEHFNVVFAVAKRKTILSIYIEGNSELSGWRSLWNFVWNKARNGNSISDPAYNLYQVLRIPGKLPSGAHPAAKTPF